MDLMLLADLYGEASGLFDRLMNVLGTDLGKLTALISAVTLTPNSAYAQAWKYVKYAWDRWVVGGGKVPIIVPGVLPPSVTVDPAKVRTAQDVKRVYDEFKTTKIARIAELETLLAKERQELVDLDRIPIAVEVTQ